jgi:hypothetical protein
MKKILDFINLIENGYEWTTPEYVNNFFDGNLEETYLLLILLSKNNLLFEENLIDEEKRGKKISVNSIIESIENLEY